MPDFKKMMANANNKINAKDTIKSVENIYEDNIPSLKSDKTEPLINTINEKVIAEKPNLEKKTKKAVKNTFPKSETKKTVNKIEDIVKTFNYQKDGVKKGINISTEHEQFIKKTARQSGMTMQQYIAFIFLTFKQHLNEYPNEIDDIFYKCKELKTSSKARFTVATMKEVADFIDEGAMKSGVSISGFQDYAIDYIIKLRNEA